MNPITRAGVLVLLLLSCGVRAVWADDVTPASAARVAAWVEAVRSHTAGQRDRATAAIAAWSFRDRQHLNDGIGLFFSVLGGRSSRPHSPAETGIVDYANAVRGEPGAAAFFKRAAILHTDVAMQRFIDHVDLVEPGVMPSTGATVAPLLSYLPLTVHRDGEVIGQSVADWNWVFARSLIDRVSSPSAVDPFIPEWYHATTAFMLQKGLHGEIARHLQHAAVRLADEAIVLFDRATFAEVQGLPPTQVFFSETDIAMRRAGQRGGRVVTHSGSPADRLDIPIEEAANQQAEQLYRKALDRDASLLEARVRLGRLLGVRGRAAEALTEIETALAQKPSSVVAFYGHLFGGRAAQALGRLADAQRHYEAAGALFPQAQSALLARSQAALLVSDVPAAVAPIHQLASPGGEAVEREDPWWEYSLASGRDADALLADMWRKVPRS